MRPFWRRLSITTKFSSGFAILLSLIVMIAVTGYLSLDYVHSVEETIQVNSDIRERVLDMERGMEKARRLHGDFFLHYPLIGIEKAHELYAGPSAEQVRSVIEEVGKLRTMMKDNRISPSLRNDQVDFNLFLSTAKRFAETSEKSFALAKELADPEDGLEPGFERLTAALQAVITSPSLADIWGKVVFFSKDYQITRHRSSMQSAFNVLAKLRPAVSGDRSLDEQAKKEILGLFGKWQDTAAGILTADLAIKHIFNDFLLQTEAMDTASANMIRLAKDDMEHSRQRIAGAHKTAVIIMAVITVAGLFLAGLIARILNASITANIIELTRLAKDFQQGKPIAASGNEGPDELGQLALTFNDMASRINELVTNLEQKVQERTAELAASEKRFRAIVENTHQGILITDSVTMEFLYANRAIAGMFGYSAPEELVGKRIPDIHPPQDLENIKYTFRGMVEGKTRLLSNIPCLRKDRSIFFADIASGELTFAGRTCLAGFFQDTTERQNLQSQLERARKMEAIGLLAGGVAHDLNNILSGIVSYPELMLLQLPEDSPLRRPIMAIHDSGKRAAAVVADLLTVARGVASPKEVTDLNALIQEYLASPEHLDIQSDHVHVTCRKDLAPDIAHISCSPIHIKKCLLNLMINSMEAIVDSGFITIATRNAEISSGAPAAAPIPPGKYAILTISDTGHGIAAQDLEHIFEPFYTKKVMGKSGTGLGLAVVWNSMQDHDGHITVESSEKGTSFHLYFPATQQKPQAPKVNLTMEELAGNGESILVIDDETQQLDIAGRILRTLRYNVHCLGSGEEALVFLEKSTVDMILLDMIMSPGMNGLETFEKILRLRPNQKVLIVSGFAESDAVHKALSLGARGFVKKPYSIDQIGLVVKDKLH